MAGAIAASADGFLTRLEAGRLPAALAATSLDEAGMTVRDLAALFESQLTSRRLDLEARRLGAEKRGFYSIGSSGHEGNAAVARAFRLDDMAFLHYRSGAFYIERASKLPGETPIWNMALSFVASSEDPISGGRHKVIGSKSLFIPPQTSTTKSPTGNCRATASSCVRSATPRRTIRPPSARSTRRPIRAFAGCRCRSSFSAKTMASAFR